MGEGAIYELSVSAGEGIELKLFGKINAIRSRYRSNAHQDQFRCMDESPPGQLVSKEPLSEPGLKYLEVQNPDRGRRNPPLRTRVQRVTALPEGL